MAISKEKILEDLRQKFSDNILDVTAQFGDDIILIKKEALLEIANFLKGLIYIISQIHRHIRLYPIL